MKRTWPLYSKVQAPCLLLVIFLHKRQLKELNVLRACETNGINEFGKNKWVSENTLFIDQW